jgi:hypothetical protein
MGIWLPRGTSSARHLATLTGFPYAGDYDALRHGDTPTYLVPSETMTTDMASRTGVGRESDLFGGVVPHPFVATKTITHPLGDTRSRAPIGWCAEFPRRVAESCCKAGVRSPRRTRWRLDKILDMARCA